MSLCSCLSLRCVCEYLDKAACCTVPPQCEDPGRCPHRRLAGGCCRFVFSCSDPLHTSLSTWTTKTSMTSCRPLNRGYQWHIFNINVRWYYKGSRKESLNSAVSGFLIKRLLKMRVFISPSPLQQTVSIEVTLIHFETPMIDTHIRGTENMCLCLELKEAGLHPAVTAKAWPP